MLDSGGSLLPRCAAPPFFPGRAARARNSTFTLMLAMKVSELKDELEARGEATSAPNKAWLRRRLHAAIVREYLDGAMADE